MKITQIRNATLRLDYGGVRFLLDPMLGEKGAYPPFKGTENSHLNNPTVPLPLPLDAILDVDAVIVTHTHIDHWDEAAARLVPKGLPLLAQHEQDAGIFRGAGFGDVRLLDQVSEFEGVGLARTGGQHGTDAAYEKIGDRLGKVCGVVFRHPREKTLYIAGDTVWNHHVEDAIARHRPDVIVLNCGDAQIIGLGSIIMTAEDVLAVHRAAPAARLVASHMEAANHCMLSRVDLRRFAEREGFASSLQVPEDGETLTI